MSALAKLQHQFRAHVLNQQDSGPFAAAVVSTAAAENIERLNVYTYAYRARLVEALGNDFSSLRTLASAEVFENFCNDYVAATPSRHFNIRWYGAGLGAFLRTTAPWSDTPGLAEMAELEWTIGLSFDAVDEDHVDTAVVATISPDDWAGMRLQLHPAVRRLYLCWNVGDIRRAIDHDETVPALGKLGTRQPWIFSRQDFVVRYRQLAVDEAAALDAVEQGATFAELCEVLCQWYEPQTVAQRAATLFKAWIQNQWIAELVLPR